MLKNDHNRLNAYQENINLLEGEIRRLSKLIDRLSVFRLLLLLLEIVLFVLLVSAKADWAQYFWSAMLLLPIAVFVMVVRKQNVVAKDLKFHKNLLWVYQNEVRMLAGEANGYDDGSKFEDERHIYSSDFDVFGPSSLYALTNRSATKIGTNKLADELSATSTKSVILERQLAIAELSEHIESTFGFRANLRGHEVTKIEEIKEKLRGKLFEQTKFTANRILRAYVKIMPVAIGILFLAALVFGGLLWNVLGLMALINAAVTYAYSKQITQVYYGFSGSSSFLDSYSEAIAWTEKYDWQSTYIKSLFGSNEKVSGHIKSLSKIIVAFDARLNFLLYAVLNFFLLWDLKCCIQLGDWTRNMSAKVEQGLDRIGYFEELISFATLSYNHPNWAFPKIEEQFTLSATNLGHPLIQKNKRVNNDFSFAKSPTVDIITGSNMAGKSTFLRTVGVNMVLAYAGAPVCATTFNLSIFKMLSYMRIKDNLIENTSTFKAELNRLRMILDEVETSDNSLVFIDEMLRGTNSKDKFDGSKAFIEKLLSLKKPALFATHDLQLSEMEVKYPLSVRNFHFDIEVSDGEMDFDYKIKDGPCTQFNAAILLRQIGLNLAD
jgi:hypothetical protein